MREPETKRIVVSKQVVGSVSAHDFSFEHVVCEYVAHQQLPN